MPMWIYWAIVIAPVVVGLILWGWWIIEEKRWEIPIFFGIVALIFVWSFAFTVVIEGEEFW